MILKSSLSLACIGLICASPTFAGDTAIDAHAGTAGLGLGATIEVHPAFNTRVGFSTLAIDESFSEDGVDYEGELELRNLYLIGDWHPNEGGFRLSTGLVKNDNEINAVGTVGSAITIGGTSITTGSVNANVTFENSIAPYVGIGWSNIMNSQSQWGFSAEVGAMFLGEPTVTITVDDPTGTVTQADIDQEQEDIKKEVDDYEMLPVFSVGLHYRF